MKYAYWLHNVPGIGRKTFQKILHHMTPKELYENNPNELKDILTEKQMFHVQVSRVVSPHICGKISIECGGIPYHQMIIVVIFQVFCPDNRLTEGHQQCQEQRHPLFHHQIHPFVTDKTPDLGRKSGMPGMCGYTCRAE